MTAATKATEYPSAVAKARFVRVSPRKARRVIDLVRGRSVSDALDILREFKEVGLDPWAPPDWPTPWPALRRPAPHGQ